MDVKHKGDGVLEIDGEDIRVSLPDDVHVMPLFDGKEHECSSLCWCGPGPLPETLNRDEYAHTVWVHKVRQ